MSKRMSTTGVPKARIDLTGKNFGHWKVIEQDLIESEKQQRVIWKCECDCGCGLQKSIRGDALKQTVVGGCNNMPMTESKICEKCGKIFYPKKQAKTRKYCYDCIPEGATLSGTGIHKIIKQWAVKYKGNKCELCGYDKCIEALDFHHLNPEEKEFSISDKNIKLDWQEVKKEIDKCILICSNCHREIHAGVRKYDKTK